MAAVSLLLAVSTMASAKQLDSVVDAAIVEPSDDAPRRMLRSVPVVDAGNAPAPAADAPALAPQGAAHHHLQRNASRTNSTGTNSSSSSSSSSSDAAASGTSSLSSSLQSHLRTVLVVALAGGFFVFAYITLTPNYVFCPTFCPLLLIW